MKWRTTSFAGFSLIELLVALLILSVGLLGFLQAELVALRNNQTAYMRSIEQVKKL